MITPRYMLFFMVLFSLAGCTLLQQSNREPELEPSEIVQVFELPEETEELEEEMEEELIPLPTVVFEQSNLTGRAITVLLENVEIKRENNVPTLYLTVYAEDLHKDIAESTEEGNFFLRDPLQWSGILFAKPGGMQNMFLCDIESDEDSWRNTYCIALDSLPYNIYTGPIFIVYTPQDVEDILRQNTLSTIDELAYTYVFRFTIKEPIP